MGPFESRIALAESPDSKIKPPTGGITPPCTIEDFSAWESVVLFGGSYLDPQTGDYVNPNTIRLYLQTHPQEACRPPSLVFDPREEINTRRTQQSVNASIFLPDCARTFSTKYALIPAIIPTEVDTNGLSTSVSLQMYSRLTHEMTPFTPDLRARLRLPKESKGLLSGEQIDPYTMAFKVNI